MTDYLAELSARHGFSRAAITEAADSLCRGDGGMAQFNHPEFGGMGQWMPGMLMIGDMFNAALHLRIDALFSEVSERLPTLEAQGARAGDSLGSPIWYPADLGIPSAVGGQNNVRYAFFPAAKRLVVEINGNRTIYDTADHLIRGVSQQQSGGFSGMTFTSQHGLVRIDSLRIAGQTA